MSAVQAFNKKTNAWVKGYIVKSKNGGKYFKATNVKQRNPRVPFKGVKRIRG